MLFAHMLSGALALATFQIHDAVSTAQNTFTACLRQFVDSSVQGRKSLDAFNSELPQQCTAQEQAYRQAMIRRDTASRISQADAEQAATEEVNYARENAKESFTNAQPQ